MRLARLQQLTVVRLLSLVGLLLTDITVHGDTATTRAAFEPQECWFEAKDSRCGYMRVPQDHTDPKSVAIRFPVVILKGEHTKSRPPIVVLGGGGPGASLGLEGEEVLGHRQVFQQIALDHGHDVILMDQRGVGRSQPSTNCSELTRLYKRVYSSTPDHASEIAGYQSALLECRSRLEKAGVDLADYDTTQSAHDVKALRDSLGYDKLILYGASYAGEIALAVIEHHREIVESTVLDSPSAPQYEYFSGIGHLYNNVFEKLFENCRQDPTCHHKFPKLRQNFLSILERLNREHPKVSVDRADIDESFRFILGRERLLNILFLFLYEPSAMAEVPPVLHAAFNNDYQSLGYFVDYFLSYSFDTRFGDGLAVATNCREEVPRTDAAAIPNDGLPFAPRWLRRDFNETKKICKRLNVGISKLTTERQFEGLPALILSGAHDPIVPPHVVAQVHRQLPDSTLIEFSEEAHFLLYNDCAAEFFHAFITPGIQHGIDQCRDEKSYLRIKTH